MFAERSYSAGRRPRPATLRVGGKNAKLPAARSRPEETTMARVLALIILLLATLPAAADPLPFELAGLAPVGAEAPICRAQVLSLDATCGPLQLAAANCGQTCYDDNANCRAGCERANRGANANAANRDKCVASCTTTYGRCQTRCAANR
jgi:hypothetical protein